MQENLPRSAATSKPHEAEILTPDLVNPTVVVEDQPKTTAPKTTGAATEKTDKNVQE